MVGAENIRAEATADVDFSRSEQAAETFKPNNSPENTVKRSEHSNESSSTEADKAGGVPGAASNQPGQGQQNQQAEAANTGPTSTQKDKTVRYVQQPMGNIKRLTVAVLVNNKTEIDADGKPTTKPLTDAEKEQITGLVKEAMGYNKERGDSLNVVNTAFTVSPKEVIPEEPFWKQFANLETAKSVGQYLLSGLVILYLFFNVLRPMIRRLSAPPVVVAPTKTNEETEQDQESAKNKSQPNQLDTAKKMAAEDPRMVANIVKTWVSE
jgi:flagellar M-ring protein FliF